MHKNVCARKHTHTHTHTHTCVCVWMLWTVEEIDPQTDLLALVSINQWNRTRILFHPYWTLTVNSSSLSALSMRLLSHQLLLTHDIKKGHFRILAKSSPESDELVNTIVISACGLWGSNVDPKASQSIPLNPTKSYHMSSWQFKWWFHVSTVTG